MLGRYVKYAMTGSISKTSRFGLFPTITHCRLITSPHFLTKKIDKLAKGSMSISNSVSMGLNKAKKSYLLYMLKTKADSLDPKTVRLTRDWLGFKTARSVFQDIIQLHLVNGGTLFTNSLAESLYIIELSNKIELANTINDLVIIYTDLKNSPYVGGFKKGAACSESALDFFILAKMSDDIHQTLYDRCIDGTHFMSSEISVYETENKQVFEILKPIISQMTSYLAEHNAHFEYYLLHENVKSAKNEVELVKALYNKNSILQNKAPEDDTWYSLMLNNKLKRWDDVRSSILYRQECFSDKSIQGIKEQLFLIFKDARKEGISFDLPEELIQKYIAAEKAYIAHSIQEDDERNSSSRHYYSLYGYTPSSEAIRHVIFKKMENGLKNGMYKEVINDMEWKCNWYEYESSKKYKNLLSKK